MLVLFCDGQYCQEGVEEMKLSQTSLRLCPVVALGSVKVLAYSTVFLIMPEL